MATQLSRPLQGRLGQTWHSRRARTPSSPSKAKLSRSTQYVTSAARCVCAPTQAATPSSASRAYPTRLGAKRSTCAAPHTEHPGRLRFHSFLCGAAGLGQTWPLVGARTAAHSVTRRRAMARGGRFRTSRPRAGGQCAQALPCTTEARKEPHNASLFASSQRDNRRATRYER